MCISQARSTWGIQVSKDPQFEASTNQRFRTRTMCISQARSTWGIQLSEDLRFKTSADQRLGTGVVQSCWENSGYCVQCTLPITFTIFQNFQKKNRWNHAIGRSLLNLSNLSLCPFIENSHLFYLQKFLLFFMAILEAKFFKIQNSFTSFEKCEQ